MLEIVPTTPAHIGAVAYRLRDCDRMECEAMGHSPKQALRLGFRTSTECYTAKVDGVPHALFGKVDVSLLDGEATPWFLGSDETYRHGREMAVVGRRLVRHWLDSSHVLRNVVAIENVRAIRMLRHWGFTVGDDIKMYSGVPFVDFWMTR